MYYKIVPLYKKSFIHLFKKVSFQLWFFLQKILLDFEGSARTEHFKLENNDILGIIKQKKI